VHERGNGSSAALQELSYFVGRERQQCPLPKADIGCSSYPFLSHPCKSKYRNTEELGKSGVQYSRPGGNGKTFALVEEEI